MSEYTRQLDKAAEQLNGYIKAAMARKVVCRACGWHSDFGTFAVWIHDSVTINLPDKCPDCQAALYIEGVKR